MKCRECGTQKHCCLIRDLVDPALNGGHDRKTDWVWVCPQCSRPTVDNAIAVKRHH